MSVEITTLEQPIDAMYLIHKALRGEADRTVEQARCLDDGCSLQSFKLAFTAWATAIMYHSEKEVGTAMSMSVEESRRTAAHDPIELFVLSMVIALGYYISIVNTDLILLLLFRLEMILRAMRDGLEYFGPSYRCRWSHSTPHTQNISHPGVRSKEHTWDD